MIHSVLYIVTQTQNRINNIQIKPYYLVYYKMTGLLNYYNKHIYKDMMISNN